MTKLVTVGKGRERPGMTDQASRSSFKGKEEPESQKPSSGQTRRGKPELGPVHCAMAENTAAGKSNLTFAVADD
jgi:hypothetical protein